jgi:hypothetical protein
MKIDKKIVKYRVQKPEDKALRSAASLHAVDLPRRKDGGKVIRMTEEIQRPEVLIGSTYKIKTPVSDHAMYVTINDIVLNEGTGVRAAPPVRGVHQLEEPRSLPVDRGAHARHLRCVPEGRRRHLPGGRAEGGVRPEGRLLAARREVHASIHR